MAPAIFSPATWVHPRYLAPRPSNRSHLGEVPAETNFLELIDRFAGRRILVVGDLMLDEFIWGRVSRISPEAPVPVVNVTSESHYPGGAANVARNLRELAAETSVLGLLGCDPQGRTLIELLQG